MSYRPMNDDQRREATDTWAAVGKPVRCGGVEAKVVAHGNKVPGAVLLDVRVDGFRWWNVDSLVPSGD